MTAANEQPSGPAPLRSIAVIGAGARGRMFAFRCVQAGFQVILEDVLSSNLRKAQEELAAEPGALQQRLHLASSVEDAVREADLAIDFVPDELESKLEIFSLIDRMAPPRTVVCTPTTLSISDLASCTYRADRCIGLQPFGDEIGYQATVVRGSATSDATVHRLTEWLQALGCTVSLLPDQQNSMLVGQRAL